ncbi:MAG: DUF4387 family protein [Roseovarius sp.]|nr:DUF4387 family protein [Roseovarius sp.]MCY4209258.1 DUF4387 family protein [Roseovarius sp.]
MARLNALVSKIRSKNAGPFWLTIDIFCETQEAFEAIRQGLTNETVARVFEQPKATVKRFELINLRVIKFSLPRPQIQGSVRDRDMHGASWAALIGSLEI